MISSPETANILFSLRVLDASFWRRFVTVEPYFCLTLYGDACMMLLILHTGLWGCISWVKQVSALSTPYVANRLAQKAKKYYNNSVLSRAEFSVFVCLYRNPLRFLCPDQSAK